MKQNLRIWTVTLLAFCLLLTACTKNGKHGEQENTPTATIANDQQLTLAMLYPDTYCPLFTKVQSNAEVLSLVYESLFKLSPEFEAVPLLAESYSFSPDGQSLTLHLRQDALWHDQSPFTASDVVFTFDLIMEDTYHSPYRSILEEVLSYQEIDAHTVRIELKEPDIFFCAKLVFPIVSKRQFGGKSELDAMLSEVPLGTGAFRFIDTANNRRLALVPNTDWWSEANPEFNAISVLVVRDEDTRYQMMNIEKISTMTTGLNDYERYTNNDSYKTIGFLGQEYTFVAFETQNELLSDPRFRRALAVSVDKEKIVKDLLFGHGVASDLPVSSEWYLYDGTEEKLSYDQALAKQLLVESGYLTTKPSEDKEKAPLKLLVNGENETKKALAEFLVRQWRLIEVNVEIEELPFEEYLKAISEGNYELALMSTLTDCSGDLQRYFKTNGVQNVFGYSNYKTDSLFGDVNRSSEEAELRKNVAALRKHLLNESPMIGLYFEPMQLLVKKELLGDFVPTVSRPYEGIWDWHFKEN